METKRFFQFEIISQLGLSASFEYIMLLVHGHYNFFIIQILTSQVGPRAERVYEYLPDCTRTIDRYQ